MIRWVGEADWWNGGRPMPVPDHYEYVFPLVEEAVEEVVRWPEARRRLTHKAWRKTTDRLEMRLALSKTSLNPGWWRPSGFGGVLKGRTSTQGSQVRILRHAVVAEDYVPPPQYEQDGVVFEPGEVYFLRTLRSTWTEEDPRDPVVMYQIVEPPPGLHQAVRQALLWVELSNSPFCVELRHHPIPTPEGVLDWKVIEVNPRLGEDPVLPYLLWPSHPLAYLGRLARMSFESHRESSAASARSASSLCGGAILTGGLSGS